MLWLLAWLTMVLRLVLLLLAPFLALLFASSLSGVFLKELFMTAGLVTFLHDPPFIFILPLLEE